MSDREWTQHELRNRQDGRPGRPVKGRWERRKKIAVVIPKFGLVGGAENFASELTTRIASDPRYDVHVFANRWSEASPGNYLSPCPHRPLSPVAHHTKLCLVRQPRHREARR